MAMWAEAPEAPLCQLSPWDWDGSAQLLLRSSFQGYKCCSLNASLAHVQINYNYSLYHYGQGHNGMVNILFAFPSWIAPLTVEWDSIHYHTGNSKILTCNLQ